MVAAKLESAKRGAEMERLTSNKTTSDMNMLELAHNSCYIDEKHNARYRDYEQDIDSRELVRKLVKDMCDEDLSYMSDERFDQYMAEMLSVGVSDTIGLLAVFYRNLWAMAELREKLKEYEDLEEQGRLIKLPCKVGDVVYAYCNEFGILEYEVDSIVIDKHITYQCSAYSGPIGDCPSECLDEIEPDISDFGKTVFLTRPEAETKLKELRGAKKK